MLAEVLPTLSFFGEKPLSSLFKLFHTAQNRNGTHETRHTISATAHIVFQIEKCTCELTQLHLTTNWTNVCWRHSEAFSTPEQKLKPLSSSLIKLRAGFTLSLRLSLDEAQFNSNSFVTGTQTNNEVGIAPVPYHKAFSATQKTSDHETSSMSGKQTSGVKLAASVGPQESNNSKRR